MIQAGAGNIFCGGLREAGEGVDVGALGAGAVHDGEIMFLQEACPAGMGAFQGLGGHQPLEGFMVGDKGEMEALRVGLE